MSGRRLGLRKRLALGIFSDLHAAKVEEHRLDTLFWECTLRCNLACRHCGSDKSVAGANRLTSWIDQQLVVLLTQAEYNDELQQFAPPSSPQAFPKHVSLPLLSSLSSLIVSTHPPPFGKPFSHSLHPERSVSPSCSPSTEWLVCATSSGFPTRSLCWKTGWTRPSACCENRS